MIAVDWGTSSLRAFRLGADGAVLERYEAPQGILAVSAGGFPATLEAAIGHWLDAGETRVLLSGMVGSRQGWVEAPYVPCPAGAAELAAGLVAAPFRRRGAEVRLVPGVSGRDAEGVPEVMRGEEVQLLGAAQDADGVSVFCLPGSHSKWVRMENGRIVSFTTHLTGEAFAALRGHTILGRMMRDGPTDGPAFDRGVVRAGQPGGLLHHLFGVRTLGLHGELAEEEAASYLSGLLIGHEIGAAMPQGTTASPVGLIGAASLCALYVRAITARGGSAKVLNPDAAATGLHRIASAAAWT